jgi:hypothetical protein
MTKSKDKQRSAELILKLYDLRREETMRKARNWFGVEFFPESVDDIFATVMGPNSGYYRMVVSYWDMACSFVTNGAIDADMFNDANGEHLFCFAKIQPFINGIREKFGNPGALRHLEQVVMDIPDSEKRLEMCRSVIERLKARRDAEIEEFASQG